MKNFIKCLLFTSTLLITACHSGNESVVPAESRDPFVGTFAVVETSPTIQGSQYAITITKSPIDKNAIEIANFANLLKKNVQAVIDGENVTIPAQTFTSNTNTTITIAGSGTLKGNSLTYTYSVKGGFKWDATCVSTKK
jgi:hypothetical protein